MSEETRKRGRPRDEELVARRQEAILAAAAQLFAEVGYRLADVQVVADRLEVGKGTVYRYFPTKEALFFAAVDAGIRALVDRIDEALEGELDPVKHLKKAIRSYLGFFDEHPDLVELLIIERAEFRDRKQATYFVYSERNHERRRSFVEKSIQTGAMRNIPADRVLSVVGDCLYGAIFTNHFSNRKVPFEKQAEDIIDVLMNGIFVGDEGKRRRAD